MGLKLGEFEGLLDGSAEGLEVGDTLGLKLGEFDGLLEGLAEGLAVGDAMGLKLGEFEGLLDGLAEGLPVGDILGIKVLCGILDGLLDGAAGDPVGGIGTRLLIGGILMVGEILGDRVDSSQSGLRQTNSPFAAGLPVEVVTPLLTK